LAVFCALPRALPQQCMSMGAMPGMGDTVPVTPPEQLPAPVHMAGIGNSHIAIKASPEVQAWFDQGLSLLHDFWDYESAKAFEQAIRLDPKCAMCYWGLAKAEEMRGSEASAYGEKALAKAVELKGHAGAEGKLYIEAAEAAPESRGGDHGGEVPILRELVKKNPGDLEARVFLAGAVGDGYDDKGEPKAGQKERVAILESVMRDAPNDSAANHYWIHAMEPSLHPEAALKSAALLASLAPNSGHMVHMPGHIFYRVGNYAEAEHWFAQSMGVDESYLHEMKLTPDDDWNYVHNMMYAIANLMEQGKLKEAGVLSDHLSAARGRLSATLYIWSARDQMTRISERLPVALRVGDWDAVLEMLSKSSIEKTDDAEGSKTANLRFLANELSEYARGMKALDSGDVIAAQDASARLDAELWRAEQDRAGKDKSKDKKDDAKKEDAKPSAAVQDKPVTEPVMPDADPSPLMSSLGIASLELRAGVLVSQGKLDAGKKLYSEATKQEKGAGYHEPPFYIRPVGENEATALLRAKDFAGAKAAYEEALKERPDSGFGLYGLARVAELSGDAAGAKANYAVFLKAWPAANPGLAELAHARSVVGEPSSSSR